MKKIYFYLFATLLCCTNLNLSAQSPSIGKDFWLTFGQNANMPASYNNLLLKFSSETNTTVRLTFTDDPTQNTVIGITANIVTTLWLTNPQKEAVIDEVNSGGNIKSSKSLHITADDNIVLFAGNLRANSSDATMILPTEMLGRNYFHAGYCPTISSISTDRDGFSVVATQPGTTTIFKDGVVVETLTQGEVYRYYGDIATNNGMAAVITNLDLTGTRISTDKPVAYFSVPNMCNVPATYNYADHLFQQLFSTEYWGTNFFVPATVQSKMRIRIIAAHDGTDVTIPGITINNAPNGAVLKAQTGIMGPIVTEPQNPNLVSTAARPTGSQASLTGLQAGQFVEIDMGVNAKGCYISATCPVMVIAYMVSSGVSSLPSASYNATATQGDPSMAYILPMEQVMRNVIVSRFNGTAVGSVIYTHYILITTATNGKENTTINGTPISGVTWNDNSGFSYCSYFLPNDNTYLVDNPNGLVATIYGYGDAETYMCGANTAGRNLNPTLKVNGEYYDIMDGKTYGCEPVTFECVYRECVGMPSSVVWTLTGAQTGVVSTSHLPNPTLGWSTTLPNDDYTLVMEVVLDGQPYTLSTHFTIAGCLLSIGNQTDTICSGETFTLPPFNGSDTIPAGITYSWAAPSCPSGVTGCQLGTNETAISGTLTNTSGVSQNVVYTVTPTANGDAGSSFTVTVTVHPNPPQITAASAYNICSGDTINLPLGSNIVAYTWTVAASGVTGASACSSGCTDHIEQTITLTSSVTSSIVTYNVTATLNGCKVTKAIEVTVNSCCPKFIERGRISIRRK